MECNLDKIKNNIEYIAQITATPDKGCTRFSYSREDRKVREYLINQMKELGLLINIDGVGNIRAKYIDDNDDASSVMIGSHIDTVFQGGKFDGILGVTAALEVIRVIKENQVKLANSIELIIFSEEEGSNFGTTLLGSKSLVGSLEVDDLKKLHNDDGISSYKIIKEFGLNPDNMKDEILRKEELIAMIELHIEQGSILDIENTPIGIVKAIAGMKTYEVKLEGVSNHAGTTPMYLRRDPMVGASKIIYYIEEVAKEKALDTTVATVGKIHCKPNASNVIPSEVRFYVDIRDVENKGIEVVSEELKSRTKEISEEYGLDYTINLVGESDCVNLSEKIINTITNVATEKGYKYKLMNSGAVHDAAMITKLTDVGMIFVPSIDGISHAPEELTRYEDIKVGCDLLLETVLNLSQ